MYVHIVSCMTACVSNIIHVCVSVSIMYEVRVHGCTISRMFACVYDITDVCMCVQYYGCVHVCTISCMRYECMSVRYHGCVHGCMISRICACVYNIMDVCMCVRYQV